jgi:UDP-N-acetylglucosamine:LPS N-acetylglucosamine transferase
MGHASVASALRERLEGEGHTARVADLFRCAMPELAPAMYRGFDLVVTHASGVYDLVHRSSRNSGGEAVLTGTLSRGLERLLDQFRPDLVLSTHPSCSWAMSRLKAQGKSRLPLVTCVTDVTDHAEWLCPGTDLYLVAAERVAAGLAAKGGDRSRMMVTGIPVRPDFVPGAPRQDGVREVLIMGGGLGLMPRSDGFYQALSALPGVRTTILTGNNQKLYDRLRGRYPHIEAVPFTREVARYMGRSHLMLSKPGGVTAFEAIAARLPMLIWEPFLAQERENARFLSSEGMGLIVPKEESACLAAIRESVYDDALLGRMRSAMERASRACRPWAAGQAVCQAPAVQPGWTRGREVCA